METENPESEVAEPVPSQVLTPGSPLCLLCPGIRSHRLSPSISFAHHYTPHPAGVDPVLRSARQPPGELHTPSLFIALLSAPRPTGVKDKVREVAGEKQRGYKVSGHHRWGLGVSFVYNKSPLCNAMCHEPGIQGVI